MHSLERYSGANSRMTFPKRCCVICCELRESVSSISPAAGEIKFAKSASDNFDLPMLARIAAESAASERLTSFSSGNELNSETKLTMAT